MKLELPTLRVRIVTDHAVLRGLFRALVVAAQTAKRDAKQRSNMTDLLRQLRDEVERHFAFEEDVLGPMMRELGLWGPVRVDRMAREHAEQRTLLDALCEEAEDGVRDVEDLGDEIAWLSSCFERDMADEERRLTAGTDVDAVAPALEAL